MCFSAIPGKNPGIHVIHCDAIQQHDPSQQEPQPKTTSIGLTTRRYHRPVRIVSSQIVPMGPGWIYWEYSRRDGRTSHERGKASRKRQHKPAWREYQKY